MIHSVHHVTLFQVFTNQHWRTSSTAVVVGRQLPSVAGIRHQARLNRQAADRYDRDAAHESGKHKLLALNEFP